MTLYDTIGNNYNTTRKADPYITGRLYELLQPVSNGQYLDIGCGTGNYLTALSEKGLRFYGIDPSETMLLEAKIKNKEAAFIKASAENIPLDNDSINGVIGTFTMHHWDDIAIGLSELYRILKPASRFVTLSFTPEQMIGYWLYHYFPKMIERSMQTIPGLATMEQLFADAGFVSVNTEKYFVRTDLQDHFLYSNKYKPEQYLIPAVRENISSFKVFSEPGEIAEGLIKLESDILSGKVNDIIRDYENDMGDYIFYIAEK